MISEGDVIKNDLTFQYKAKKIAVVSGATAIFAFIIFFIGCPFYFVSHIPCPGCGMTRAMLSFFSLHIETAFYYHALFPIVLIAAVIFIVCVVTYMKKERKNFFTFTLYDLDIVMRRALRHMSAKIFLIISAALFILLYFVRLFGLLGPMLTFSFL